ncbi:MAG TPA: Hsp70 family protein [Pirellulaceae bacterium]|nr:Hsp70 family protein [Pirellulaceae bacterium]HMO92950.1 Hsp70 family protein [Pirellulaceae bacterium]HMP68485.1 Hsp70 family protein [Pirellulaceae bacterium]
MAETDSHKRPLPHGPADPAKRDSVRGIPLGIDLGTTYSVAAYLNPLVQPISIVNAEGDLLTPSVLLFEAGNVIVGREAVKALATDFAKVIDCPKRSMGSRVVEKAIDGRRYPPEVLQAWILKKIADDAARHIGTIGDVVITVPAYFDETRRKATHDAGYIAGLNVIDIINEPTAAALAYGFRRGWIEGSGEFADAKTFLVYDLGGGTFDATLMRIDKSGFHTIATDGDIHLGGRDWDLRLVKFVAESFIANFGMDPRDDGETLGQLIRDCQAAKESLSVRDVVTVKCTFNGLTVKKIVRRSDFETLTRDLLERTAFTTRQIVKEANLQWTDVDVVLMVGGCTRMPAVKNLLREVTGKEPQSDISPDEAVAQGAAIRASLLSNEFPRNLPKLKIKNVNSHSLGIVAQHVRTGQERVVPIIPRNSPIPASSKRTFKIHRVGQETIKVRIVEGESENPQDCALIGKCSIVDLPKNLPVGTQVSIKFGYEESGRLSVKVKVGDHRKPYRYRIDRPNSLTHEQLDSWKAFINGNSSIRWKSASGET